MKMAAQEEHRASGIVVSGDGRMDSPGHTAKYCTYTIMNQSDKKILAMEVVDKREVELKSARMEARGFTNAMADLQTAGIVVKEAVTDAHPQISSIMKKQFPHICHSWDMWHGAKNLGKKLSALASEKGKDGLKPWVKDITNHFYYSAEHCGDQEHLLKTKLVSVLNHCTNQHETALTKCDHGPLSEEDRQKPWLAPTGPEMTGLRNVMLDRRFMNTLKYYTTCQTTSELESFNSHLLMYASKRQAFSYPVYKCRSQLAAIEYMYHIDRPLRKTKKGEYMYNRQYSKATSHWGYREVKEQKTYAYIHELLCQIMNTYCQLHKNKPLTATVELARSDPRRIAKHIAPCTPPPTKDIVQAKKARISK